MSEYKNRREFEANIITKVWQNEAFKKRLMSNPKFAIAEVGISLPEDIKVEVIEETERTFYLVLPQLPSQLGELSEADLESVVGGKSYNPWKAADVY